MNKRETILLAGQRLFARFGLYKTTVEEIIRLAQIAKGTFYRYFPDKEALFREVIEREGGNLIEAVRTAVSEAASSKEKMRAYMVRKAEKIQELANLYQVTRETVDEFWPQISEAREKYFLEEQKIIRDILTDGVRQGELTVGEIELTAYAIVIAVRGLEMPWMLETSPMELEKGVDVILNMLFDGIRAR